MYASVRRYIVKKGNEASAIKHAVEGVVPALRAIPGFVEYFFIDTGDGEMIGVNLFESPEGAERANQLAREYVAANLDRDLKQITSLEGTVVAHARGNK
jgi:hypothetical protein